MIIKTNHNQETWIAFILTENLKSIIEDYGEDGYGEPSSMLSLKEAKQLLKTLEE